MKKRKKLNLKNTRRRASKYYRIVDIDKRAPVDIMPANHAECFKDVHIRNKKRILFTRLSPS